MIRQHTGEVLLPGMQLNELDCKPDGWPARVFERAASRIGRVTRHLEFLLEDFTAPNRPCEDNPFIDALLPRKAHLAYLKCLELCVTSPNWGGQPLLEDLLSWLLNESLQLEALSLRGVTCLQLADATPSFQHMEHLELHAETLPGFDVSASKCPSFEPGEYFPSLQTLLIRSTIGTISVMQRLDDSECPQLKKLRLDTMNVRELVKRPECNLRIDIREDDRAGHSIWLDEIASHLPACSEVSIDAEDGTFLSSAAARGVLGPLAALQRLFMFWPCKLTDVRDYDWDNMREDAEHLLANLLPANGQPFVNLRVLAVCAISMKCAIPRGLSNLEELSIYADGCLDLSFEVPGAVASTLNIFYAFGQPLITQSTDMLTMCGSMATRGKVLAAVPAPADMDPEWECSGSTCIYMRPVMAIDESIEVLLHVVRGRAEECRCSMCFHCLERSNKDGWWCL